MIRLELHVEINFYFNLILNYEACKLSKHFLKFVFEIFPAKSCCEFRSYPSGVIVVEGFGCGRAKGPSPLRGLLESETGVQPIEQAIRPQQPHGSSPLSYAKIVHSNGEQ
jgi:hypothetical protein